MNAYAGKIQTSAFLFAGFLFCTFGGSQDRQVLEDRWYEIRARVLMAHTSGKDVSAVLERLKSVTEDYLRSKNTSRAEENLREAELLLQKIFPERLEQQFLSRLKGRAELTTLHLLGQCHIDLSWRWPWTETVQIAQSTFLDQILAMDRNSDYHYYQNQVALYEAVERQDPALFRAIQQMVQKGRWHIVGGQWAETAQEFCLGESLVRNYLYGQRYLENKFGKRAQIGWQMEGSLYLSPLPQIMSQSGIEAAILGRQSNWGGPWRPLIRWRGADGTTVPVSCIVGYGPWWNRDRVELARDLFLFDASSGSSELLLPYGGGDHGGGSSPQLGQTLKNDFEGIGFPVPMIDTDLPAYFDRTFGSDSNLVVPTFSGHLQLPRSGSSNGMISQQKVKKKNRESENLLYAAEFWTTVARGLDAASAGVSLEPPWRKLLVNQFHDAIWGTTVFEANQEALVRYELIKRAALGATAQALGRVIVPRIDTRGDGQAVVVFNPLPWPRTGPVEIDPSLPRLHGIRGDLRVRGTEPARVAVDSAGDAVPVQVTWDDKYLFVAREVPAGGYRVYWVRNGGSRPSGLRVSEKETARIENDLLRVDIDRRKGSILSVFNKESGTKLVAKGGGLNSFEIYRDLGSAWRSDLREKILEEAANVEVASIEVGPVRVGIEVQTNWNDRSSTRRRIFLYEGLRRIEVQIDGDWREPRTQLMVAFPADSVSVITEIPFGYLDADRYLNDRPAFDPMDEMFSVPAENPWELPMNRWAVIENAEWTMGILNDGKAAIRLGTGGVALPILRTPPYPLRGREVGNPDPEPGEPGYGAPQFSDLGEFEASYAIIFGPHSWRAVEIPRRALEINSPLWGWLVENHDGPLPSESTFFSVRPSNLLPSAVKMAEDGSGDVILRIYEAHGQDAEGLILLPRTAVAVWESNLLEDNSKTIAENTDRLSVHFRPHEIRTLRLRFRE